MTVETQTHFDYIIIGNGLSGSQLALAFTNDSYFNNKKIGIIEKESKTINDKTWCFWEKGDGQWDLIVEQSWTKALYKSPNKDLKISLDPYRYKMIRSIDFYNFSRNNLSKNDNISIIKDEVRNVTSDISGVIVYGIKTKYTCTHLFDSRIPEAFLKDKKSIKLIQHFKGYVIETKEDCFKTDEFVMMDYRCQEKNTTSFMYVLPSSEKKALLEFTFFSPNLVNESIYDEYLSKYITNYINISDYTIIEIEKGKIPMTDFNFEKYNSKDITKIGTGGGWVKGSTGYSFKHTEKKIKIIVENIKSSKSPSTGLIKKRFKLYDAIFLKVLYDYNDQGMSIFDKFYSKNKAVNYLSFLDEETNLVQEIKILSSLYSSYFIKSFFKYFLRT